MCEIRGCFIYTFIFRNMLILNTTPLSRLSIQNSHTIHMDDLPVIRNIKCSIPNTNSFTRQVLQTFECPVSSRLFQTSCDFGSRNRWTLLQTPLCYCQNNWLYEDPQARWMDTICQLCFSDGQKAQQPNHECCHYLFQEAEQQASEFKNYTQVWYKLKLEQCSCELDSF